MKSHRMWSFVASFSHSACGLFFRNPSDSYSYSRGLVCTDRLLVPSPDGASAVPEQVLGHTARNTAAVDGVFVISCWVTNGANTGQLKQQTLITIGLLLRVQNLAGAGAAGVWSWLLAGLRDVLLSGLLPKAA